MSNHQGHVGFGTPLGYFLVVRIALLTLDYITESFYPVPSDCHMESKLRYLWMVTL